MWLKIKKWYEQNKMYLATLLIASLLVGLIIGTFSFISPLILHFLAEIVVLGGTPFAFLNIIPFPLAVMSLSLMATGIALTIFSSGMLLAKQLTIIGTNVRDLFKPEDTTNSSFGLTSYAYLNQYLQSNSSESIDCDEEESDDLSFDDESAVKTAANEPKISLPEVEAAPAVILTLSLLKNESIPPARVPTI